MVTHDIQEVHARWLTLGVRLGFAALIASFAVYLFGVLPAHVPPAQLPAYWGLSAVEYAAATGGPTGWEWIRRVGEGDILNFAGVAILAATTLVANIAVLASLWRSHERILKVICVVQIVILVAAASGQLHSSHAKAAPAPRAEQPAAK